MDHIVILAHVITSSSIPYVCKDVSNLAPIFLLLWHHFIYEHWRTYKYKDNKFMMPSELPHFSCEFTQMSSEIFLNLHFCLSTFPMVLNILLTCSNFVPCLRIVCCFHNQIIWTWNPSWFHWTSSFSIFYELSENVAEICWEDTEELSVSVKAVSKLISLSRLFVCVF